MSKLKYTLLALSVSAGLIGCGGGGGGGSDRDNAGGGGGQQTEERNVVNGLVMDSATGLRLAGVTVSGGGQQAETNASGEYSLALPPSDQPVTLSFSRADYAPGFDNVKVNEDSDALLVALKKQGELQDYNIGTTKTIFETTEAGPYAVIFQPNTLNSDDTDLRVSVTPLDPTIEGDVLPGELGKADVMLTPLTFAEFTILDSNGNHVNLRPGSEAVVELPIPPTLRDRPEYALGQTIHCYSFNPETGQWEDFVVGVISLSSVDGVTPVVKATVKHFSWYGAAPESEECEWVVGTVVDIDGNPMPGARVEAFPGTVTKTDSNGFFQVVTSKGSSPDIVATRTYIDTNGSVSGMPGAKVIDFGKVKVDDLLYPLVSCSDVLNTGAARTTPPPGPNDDYPQVQVTMGAIGTANYEANASLSDTGVSLLIDMLLPTGETAEEAVSGAKVTLTTSQGNSIPVDELVYDIGNGTQGTGYYTATFPVIAGERYTLNIDIDNNGTIDGSGSAYAIGDLAWSNPTENSTVSSANFTASWTDTGAGISGYAPIYYAYITPKDYVDDTASYKFGYYLGRDPQFAVTAYGEEDVRLPAGTYSALVYAFSGAADLGLNNLGMTNNITGSTVNGIFWSMKTHSVDSFTITP